MKKQVLFVCIHNSARSQMAEAFLNHLCGGDFEAHSAGLEPGKLNPLVVEVMREAGLDISGNRTKSVFDMIKSGGKFAYVITVCDEASAERCPIFPGGGERMHLGFSRPLGLPRQPRGSSAKDARSARCHPTEDCRMVRRDWRESRAKTVAAVYDRRFFYFSLKCAGHRPPLQGVRRKVARQRAQRGEAATKKK